MLYLLALVLPPAALLVAGKVVQAIPNLIIWVLAVLVLVGTLGFGMAISFVLWLICALHALFTVNAKNADDRTKQLIDAAGSSGPSEMVTLNVSPWGTPLKVTWSPLANWLSKASGR